MHTIYRMLLANNWKCIQWQILDDNTYVTAQRKRDAHTRVAGWILSGEYCRVKITSCVQYLNRGPLRICPHQANCLACAPAYVTLISNELLNQIWNINSMYMMNLWILSLYVLIDPWIHCPTEKLFACSISNALLFGQVWRMDLV